jgi:hypothetical protein
MTTLKVRISANQQSIHVTRGIEAEHTYEGQHSAAVVSVLIVTNSQVFHPGMIDSNVVTVLHPKGHIAGLSISHQFLYFSKNLTRECSAAYSSMSPSHP